MVYGQYDITFKDFKPLYVGDTKNVNLDKIKLKRFNRTSSHVFKGEIELFVELGPETELIAELYKQQGYEYRLTPYKIKMNVCDIIANEKVFYPKILEQTDFPPIGTVSSNPNRHFYLFF